MTNTIPSVNNLDIVELPDNNVDKFDTITKTRNVKTTVHRFYIDEGISRDENWVYPLKKILAGTNTGDDDTVVELYMNTYGGDVYLALELIELINRSPLKVNVYIDSICMSAGTLILFSCEWNKVVINPNASFLFHDVRTFEFGKKSDIIDSINHLNTLITRIANSAYRGFLTSSELKQISNGKELYMLGEEVVRRIKQRIDKETKKKKRPAKTAKSK